MSNSKTSPTLKSCLRTDKREARSSKVRFSRCCSIVLIPLSIEYVEAGISLWWTKKEMSSFKNGFTEEKNERLAKELASSILVVSDDYDRKMDLAIKMSSLVDKRLKFKGCSPSELKSILTRFKQSFTAVVIDTGCNSSSSTVRIVRSICPRLSHTAVYSEKFHNPITQIDEKDIDGPLSYAGALVLSCEKVSNFDDFAPLTLPKLLSR